jgi:hypothetical protein
VFFLPPDLGYNFQVFFWWDGDEVIALVVPVKKKNPTIIEVQLYCNKQQLEACPPSSKFLILWNHCLFVISTLMS